MTLSMPKGAQFFSSGLPQWKSTCKRSQSLSCIHTPPSAGNTPCHSFSQYLRPSRMAALFFCRRTRHSRFSSHPALYSSINLYHARYAACTSYRRKVMKSSPCLFGINQSLFSTIATDDEYDNQDISNSNVEHHANRDTDGTDSTASLRHCGTCSCSTTDDGKSTIAAKLRQSTRSETLRNSQNRVDQQDTTNDGDGLHYDLEHHSWSPPVCHQSEHIVAPNTPLPPPLPKPEYSFKRRILPPNLLAFNSTEGKSRFLHSLQTNYAEAYIPLSQQFLNQMDPAYCGVSTLILILNALAIDPNVRWRGGWRWYGDESMLLERCCLEEERVRREGISLEQYCGLARCQGAALAMKRPIRSENEISECSDDSHSLEEFRRDVINAVRMPPSIDWDGADIEADADVQPSRSNGGYFLVASFARSSLGQTGDGHFSPIAAYHPPTDSCLVLDVARFKYSPFWVPVKELYDAMIPADSVTGKSRGWVLMFPPVKASEGKKRGTKEELEGTKESISREELEGKRPAACVPLAGTGEHICPLERIKVEYCSVGK